MTDNKQLVESLDKHLAKVNEIADYSAAQFLRELETKNFSHDKNFAKLVYELLKDTVNANAGRLQQPDFNKYKALLIKDIKYNVTEMVKEGMSKEEAIELLLDPTKYDGEVGNYVDTSFADMYVDGYDGKINEAAKILIKYEDVLLTVLGREVKKNYKQLMQAVK